MFKTLSEFRQILREAFFMEIEELQKKPGRNRVPRRERAGPTWPDSLAMWGVLICPPDFRFASFSTPTLRLDLKTINIYPFLPM
jgi:hypothetical protein